MLNEPLGLPKGTVRALLAIAITVSAIVGLFLRPEAAEKILPPWMAVLAFYFGSRSDFGKTGGQ